MTQARAALDLLGIGNAIADLVAPAPPAWLAAHGLAPGAMTLVDEARAAAMTRELGEVVATGGGSAANTCVAAASLGARVGFLGKVADDDLGRAFAEDLRAAGVRFPTAPLKGGAPTARCVVLVGPDGGRTMATHLGACVAFGEADVDPAEVASAAVTYLEGYLFDPPEAQAAFRRAAAIARGAGRRVALTLSDPFCVGRHREAFLGLLPACDLVFANEEEALALFEVSRVEEAAAALAGRVPLAALTRSEKGSLVLNGGAVQEVAAEPATVIDTTGAGDAYAAGFLAGLTRGLPPAVCGRWGSLAAAEAISHFGARPRRDLRALVEAG